MKKILRNMSTEESRVFWKSAESTAAEVEQWPAWKRAGINVVHIRKEAIHVRNPRRHDRASERAL